MTKRTWILLGILAALVAVFALRPAPEGRVGIPAPTIANQTWLNSEPKSMADLKGKVVLVEFWTFACYNCRNVEPYVKDWHKKYSSQGLVVIGVHSPELDYEYDIENVKRHMREHDIQYAIAIDNDFTTWDRYGNRYWPAFYLIDKQGIIRYTRFGEGAYAQTEKQIQSLLAEQ
ncbi:MAG TPA: redoxin domain-containing protein [Nitrospiraceae bacterium]|nr:redoxin domain-containing protein [Nitrospiraceae bacterium]